ncbi:hypothetical protein, partial [Desulfosarcina cetonica]|uniref:hypothetical protein n=1 Tax=Desulfosarcina cetonica TaxID=90730 RepID=UPI001C447AB3
LMRPITPEIRGIIGLMRPIIRFRLLKRRIIRRQFGRLVHVSDHTKGNMNSQALQKQINWLPAWFSFVFAIVTFLFLRTGNHDFAVTALFLFVPGNIISLCWLIFYGYKKLFKKSEKIDLAFVFAPIICLVVIWFSMNQVITNSY